MAGKRGRWRGGKLEPNFDSRFGGIEVPVHSWLCAYKQIRLITIQVTIRVSFCLAAITDYIT